MMQCWLNAPKNIDHSKINMYSRIGILGGENVLFHVPLIVSLDKTKAKRTNHTGILTNIESDNIMDWLIFFPKPRQCGNEVSIGKLENDYKDTFLQSLLVLVQNPADLNTYCWYPWILCNPYNLFGYTIKSEPYKVKIDDSLKLDALKLKPSLSEDYSNLPYMPSTSNYIPIANLKKLAIERTLKLQQLRSMDPNLDIEEKEEAKSSMECTSIDNILTETPDNVSISNDERPNLCAKYYSFDDMINKYPENTQYIKMFFHSTGFRVKIRKDYKLPILLSVLKERTTSNAKEALLCQFKELPKYVWVQKNILLTIKLHLISHKNIEAAKPYYEIAKNYNEMCVQFENIRPTSPFQWTQDEDHKYTKGQLKMSSNDELREAKRVLYEQAQKFIFEELDCEKKQTSERQIHMKIEKKYEELLSIHPYLTKLTTANNRRKRLKR